MKHLVFAVLFVIPITGFAQTDSEAMTSPVYYTAVVTDSGNLTHNLTKVTISGYTWFHGILKGAMFRINFDKIQTITFTATPEPPFKGYKTSTVGYSGGGQSQLYIDTDNYRIEGFDEKLQVQLKIPLSDITTITLTPEAVPQNKPETDNTSISKPPPGSTPLPSGNSENLLY